MQLAERPSLVSPRDDERREVVLVVEDGPLPRRRSRDGFESNLGAEPAGRVVELLQDFQRPDIDLTDECRPDAGGRIEPGHGAEQLPLLLEALGVLGAEVAETRSSQAVRAV